MAVIGNPSRDVSHSAEDETELMGTIDAAFLPRQCLRWLPGNSFNFCDMATEAHWTNRLDRTGRIVWHCGGAGLATRNSE